MNKQILGSVMSELAGKSRDGKQDIGARKIAKLVGILFMARTYGHLAHLKTSSYAKHKALDDFYNAAGDFGDTLAEVAQGRWGKLDIPFESMNGSVSDPIAALEMQLAEMEDVMKDCEYGEIENIFQEVQAMYRKTLYFLKELN